MTKLKRLSAGLAATAAALFTQGAVAQEIIPVTLPQDTNLVGLGIFAVPDYYGSSMYKAAPGPLVHYNFDFGYGPGLYVQLVGPEIRLNLMPRTDWRVGPLFRFRQRRDDDVGDEVVSRMQHIPSASEIGAFAAYHMPLDPNHPMHKIIFTGDFTYNTTHVYDGATGNLRATYVHPFDQPFFGFPLLGTIGFGLFFASDHFADKYFGVNGSDIALFPSLDGQRIRAEGGITSVKIPFSLSSQVDPQWLVTVAGRYELLLRDARASPVVKKRGDENQWIIGIAGSYLF
jgi:outer membrane scaffolding protein for murein synthesis (MipA/OmpV family)